MIIVVYYSVWYRCIIIVIVCLLRCSIWFVWFACVVDCYCCLVVVLFVVLLFVLFVVLCTVSIMFVARSPENSRAGGGGGQAPYDTLSWLHMPACMQHRRGCLFDTLSDCVSTA